MSKFKDGIMAIVDSTEMMLGLLADNNKQSLQAESLPIKRQAKPGPTHSFSDVLKLCLSPEKDFDNPKNSG